MIGKKGPLLRKSGLLCAVSVLAIAVYAAPADHAKAADAIIQPQTYIAPAPLSRSWGGFSVGFGVGVDHFNTTSNLNKETWFFADDDSVSEPGGSFDSFEEFCGKGAAINDYSYCNLDSNSADLGTTGAYGTVELGYDWQHGEWVFGVFGDWSFGDADAGQSSMQMLSGEFDGLDFKGTTYAEGSVSFEDEYSIIGRAGRIVHEDVLVYGLFGWTWQDYAAQVREEDDFDIFNGKGSGFGGESRGSASGTTDGLTLGAGSEIRLHDDWSLKTEYRWTQLDGISVETTEGDGDCGFPKGDCVNGGWAEFTTDDIDKHSVRAVLSYKFNGPHPLH